MPPMVENQLRVLFSRPQLEGLVNLIDQILAEGDGYAGDDDLVAARDRMATALERFD